jgi:hypothetical protein
MRPVEITPTTVDREIASAVAQHTNPAVEQAAQVVTWGADEYILVTAAVALWLFSRRGNKWTRTASTSFSDVGRDGRHSPRSETHLQPASAGSSDGNRLSPWHPDIRASERFISFGTCRSYGSTRGRRVGVPSPISRAYLERRDRSFDDEDRRSRALEQRCRRGLRRRISNRTARQALDRLW